MKMTYKKESKKEYIIKHTELFAHELYLNQKYKRAQECNLQIQLDSFLAGDWWLSKSEKKKMIKDALKIAKKTYRFVY